MVRLVKVVAELVRKSRSQLWFWLQLAGEARRTWDCVNASHRKLCEFCISTNLVITSIVIIFVIIERRT